MSITISIPEKPVLKPKIVVFGVGGGGCNAVNNMIHSDLEGVDFVVANTDAQSLAQNTAERCIQMGAKRTQGLGAGSHPEIGFEAAEEVIGDISDAIHGAHMVFVTAGMGGGTGTGAAPVVARLAKEMGALTVGVVTKPFMFEGNRRMAIAEAGIEEMQKYVDTLLIIPNQNLFRVASEQTALTEAFAMADRVLFSAVAGITNLMVRPGMINLDFADVRTVMGEMGKAMIGTGEAEGEKRGIEAAEHALNNPLLDDVSMKGARGVLISISGDDNMKLYEVEEAANRIRSEVDPDAQIIFGATTDSSLGQTLRISVVATGIDQQDTLLPDSDSLEEEDQPQDDSKEKLTLVGGMEGNAALETAPMDMTPDEMPSQDRPQPRPFQIVPPVKTAFPEAPPAPVQKAKPSAAAIAEESAAAPAPAPAAAPSMEEGIASPPPPPYSSEAIADDPSGGDSFHGSPSVSPPPHPFGHLPASMTSSTSPASSLGARRQNQPPPPPPRSAEKPPAERASKGFFGRLKERLRVAMDDADAPAPQNPIHQPLQEAQPAEKINDDDQLEIPDFLRSQTR